MTLNDLHLKIILIDRKWSISVNTLLYLTSSNSSISSFELNNFFLISWTVFFGWNLNSVWLIHFEVRLSLKITTIKLFFVSCSVIWIICLIWASWILQMFFASSIKVFRILFFTFLGFKNNRYLKVDGPNYWNWTSLWIWTEWLSELWPSTLAQTTVRRHLQQST